MDHTITTTLNEEYEVFLPKWLRAVEKLEDSVAEVVVVLQEPSPWAIQLVDSYGYRVVKIDRPKSQGEARNIAVAETKTEWVQIIDVDDVPFGNSISTTAELIQDADVVSWAFEREGKKKVYRHHQGRPIGADDSLYVPASSASPFRRSLWEESPFMESLPSFWDTALWIGFCHLGARYVPTKEAMFTYVQHGRSITTMRERSETRRLFEHLRQLALDEEMFWREARR